MLLFPDMNKSEMSSWSLSLANGRLASKSEDEEEEGE